MPAQHAALLKDVKVQVYGRSYDIYFNGESGYTNIYDKANNTISIADAFEDPTLGVRYMGGRRLQLGGPVGSIEHNTMRALAAALDDKLDGAGRSGANEARLRRASRKKVDGFLLKRNRLIVSLLAGLMVRSIGYCVDG